MLPSRGYGIAQVPRNGNQFLNVLFDITRLEMRRKQDTLAESVGPGYPVLLNAAEIEPRVPGYTENIAYYASAVTFGDEDEHNGFPVDYSTLKLGGETTLEEGQKLSRAALAVQLDLCAKGEPTPLFHTFSDMLDAGTGTVVMKNQSVMLVKLEQDRAFALQILESVMLTEHQDECSNETFEVGDRLRVNAVLMNPALPTQYVVTGSWAALGARPSIPREELNVTAIDMFSSLAVAYCGDPASYAVPDVIVPAGDDVLIPAGFDDVLIPGGLDDLVVPVAGGLGFDDIAADMTDDIGVGVEDDIGMEVEDSDIGVEEEDKKDKPLSAPSLGLKFASFAK